MEQITPTLGLQQVSPGLPSKLAPLPKSTQRGDRIAVIVAHGMGQQVPYETIEGVAKAVWRGAQLLSGVHAAPAVVRSVRLAAAKENEPNPEFVRAEFALTNDTGTHDVHIYEAYWAPLTEGKVTASDVISFLFDAGWNGIKNTTARTYRRWMFGKEQEFSLPTERLLLAFLFVLALVGALLLINGVLAAASASHVIGSSNPFPTGDLLAALTWDLLLVDCCLGLIALGIFVFGRLPSAWMPRFGWLLIYLGAAGIVAAAALMIVHLAGGSFTNFATPGVAWAQGVKAHPKSILFLWAAELWAAYQVRWFLIEYVGDVAAYIAAHTVSKFAELRQQIWTTAMNVARAVYQARTADGDEFLYGKVVVVGHSLGSVIGYDVLNGLLLEDGYSRQALDVARRTGTFITFGSPLDKTAFVFRTQQDMNSAIREVAAAAVQPMIASYRDRPNEWINLWSPSDIISGHLDYYDPPTERNAKIPEKGVREQPSRAVQNVVDREARMPLGAHVQYWDGKCFAEKLVKAILSNEKAKENKMELVEAGSLTKAILLSAASLAGLGVSPQSPERFVVQVQEAFDRPGVQDTRRPEAVANLLRWMAATLEIAQQQGNNVISESTADAGRQKVCPVFPFD